MQRMMKNRPMGRGSGPSSRPPQFAMTGPRANHVSSAITGDVAPCPKLLTANTGFQTAAEVSKAQFQPPAVLLPSGVEKPGPRPAVPIESQEYRVWYERWYAYSQATGDMSYEELQTSSADSSQQSHADAKIVHSRQHATYIPPTSQSTPARTDAQTALGSETSQKYSGWDKQPNPQSNITNQMPNMGIKPQGPTNYGTPKNMHKNALYSIENNQTEIYGVDNSQTEHYGVDNSQTEYYGVDNSRTQHYDVDNNQTEDYGHTAPSARGLPRDDREGNYWPGQPASGDGVHNRRMASRGLELANQNKMNQQRFRAPSGNLDSLHRPMQTGIPRAMLPRSNAQNRGPLMPNPRLANSNEIRQQVPGELGRPRGPHPERRTNLQVSPNQGRFQPRPDRSYSDNEEFSQNNEPFQSRKNVFSSPQRLPLRSEPYPSNERFAPEGARFRQPGNKQRLSGDEHFAPVDGRYTIEDEEYGPRDQERQPREQQLARGNRMPIRDGSFSSRNESMSLSRTNHMSRHDDYGPTDEMFASEDDTDWQGNTDRFDPDDHPLPDFDGSVHRNYPLLEKQTAVVPLMSVSVNGPSGPPKNSIAGKVDRDRQFTETKGNMQSSVGNHTFQNSRSEGLGITHLPASKDMNSSFNNSKIPMDSDDNYSDNVPPHEIRDVYANRSGVIERNVLRNGPLAGPRPMNSIRQAGPRQMGPNLVGQMKIPGNATVQPRPMTRSPLVRGHPPNSNMVGNALGPSIRNPGVVMNRPRTFAPIIPGSSLPGNVGNPIPRQTFAQEIGNRNNNNPSMGGHPMQRPTIISNTMTSKQPDSHANTFGSAGFRMPTNVNTGVMPPHNLPNPSAPGLSNPDPNVMMKAVSQMMGAAMTNDPNLVQGIMKNMSGGAMDSNSMVSAMNQMMMTAMGGPKTRPPLQQNLITNPGMQSSMGNIPVSQSQGAQWINNNGMANTAVNQFATSQPRNLAPKNAWAVAPTVDFTRPPPMKKIRMEHSIMPNMVMPAPVRSSVGSGTQFAAPLPSNVVTERSSLLFGDQIKKAQKAGLDTSQMLVCCQVCDDVWGEKNHPVIDYVTHHINTQDHNKVLIRWLQSHPNKRYQNMLNIVPFDTKSDEKKNAPLEKKLKSAYFCEVCEMPAGYKRKSYSEHLKHPSHINKVMALMKSLKPFTPPSAKTQQPTELKDVEYLLVPTRLPQLSRDKNRFKTFPCQICAVAANDVAELSFDNWMDHMCTPFHMSILYDWLARCKALAALPYQKLVSFKGAAVTQKKEPHYFCEVCLKKVEHLDDVIQEHLKSSKHKKRYEELKVKVDTALSGGPVTRILADEQEVMDSTVYPDDLDQVWKHPHAVERSRAHEEKRKLEEEQKQLQQERVKQQQEEERQRKIKLSLEQKQRKQEQREREQQLREQHQLELQQRRQQREQQREQEQEEERKKAQEEQRSAEEEKRKREEEEQRRKVAEVQRLCELQKQQRLEMQERYKQRRLEQQQLEEQRKKERAATAAAATPALMELDQWQPAPEVPIVTAAAAHRHVSAQKQRALPAVAAQQGQRIPTLQQLKRQTIPLQLLAEQRNPVRISLAQSSVMGGLNIRFVEKKATKRAADAKSSSGPSAEHLVTAATDKPVVSSTVDVKIAETTKDQVQVSESSSKSLVEDKQKTQSGCSGIVRRRGPESYVMVQTRMEVMATLSEYPKDSYCEICPEVAVIPDIIQWLRHVNTIAHMRALFNLARNKKGPLADHLQRRLVIPHKNENNNYCICEGCEILNSQQNMVSHVSGRRHVMVQKNLVAKMKEKGGWMFKFLGLNRHDYWSKGAVPEADSGRKSPAAGAPVRPPLLGDPVIIHTPAPERPRPKPALLATPDEPPIEDGAGYDTATGSSNQNPFDFKDPQMAFLHSILTGVVSLSTFKRLKESGTVSPGLEVKIGREQRAMVEKMCTTTGHLVISIARRVTENEHIDKIQEYYPEVKPQLINIISGLQPDVLTLIASTPILDEPPLL